MTSIQFYNSLTRRVEPFRPATTPKVNMFVCGPTVYDFIHLGNARTFTVFDVVAKWLRYRDFDVRYIQNITDIDDRIIKRAADEGVAWKAIADRYTEAFLRDTEALQNTAVNEYARASEHIHQVKSQIKVLIKKGHAYRIPGDGWYFDLATFPEYGKLSGRTALEADDAVSRIDESGAKRNTGDFALWKEEAPGTYWDDPELGPGRPGWHIEDTAITEHFFGPQYDLHGGGRDLLFPHHEAEVTQQEAASEKKPFVAYWMHVGFLQMANAKMSKSLGNILSLHEALERYSSEAVRFFLLSAHYREPLTFTDASLDAAAAAVQRISELARKVATLKPHLEGGDTGIVQEAQEAIGKAMDDDFNTPRAFGALFTLITQVNELYFQEQVGSETRAALEAFLAFVNEQFGIVPSTDIDIPEAVQILITERQRARDAKDFASADQLRDQIIEAGYSIDDTPYGPLVKKQGR